LKLLMTDAALSRYLVSPCVAVGFEDLSANNIVRRGDVESMLIVEFLLCICDLALVRGVGLVRSKVSENFWTNASAMGKVEKQKDDIGLDERTQR
jgi:hypothetical protein